MGNWKETKCGKCKIQREKPICNSCRDYNKFVQITNADRIRSMSDEELAKLIAENIDCTMCPFVNVEEKCGEIQCSKLILEWLQSEVEE